MKWFRTQPKPSPFEPQAKYYGLSEVEFTQLATYNSEKARGIMHTDFWAYKMSILQRRYRAGESIELNIDTEEMHINPNEAEN